MKRMLMRILLLLSGLIAGLLAGLLLPTEQRLRSRCRMADLEEKSCLACSRHWSKT
jgi:hypothetical protein